MLQMEGKVAIVAGVGPGIGRSCALALSAAGAQVVIAARRVDQLNTTAAEITAATGREVEVVPTDLSVPSSCEALVEATITRFGGVDSLVAVATTGGAHSTVDDGDWEMWRRAFDLNVVGAMVLSRSAARSMAARGGGSIVHVGSMATRLLLIGNAAYNATKLAALGAAKTLAKELAPAGTRVNVVTPGFVDGDKIGLMFEAIAARTGRPVDEVAEEMTTSSALGRLVRPDEIAQAVLFLCSSASSGITGVDLPVSAGLDPL